MIPAGRLTFLSDESSFDGPQQGCCYSTPRYPDKLWMRAPALTDQAARKLGHLPLVQCNPLPSHLRYGWRGDDR